MSSEVYPTLPGIAFGTQRTYSFATTVQENVSGKEVREALRANPIRSWKLNYEFLRQYGSKNEFRTLVGFFLRMRGASDDFLFNDIADYTVTDAPLGTGDGATRAFQLVRPFEGFAEPIQSPNVINNVKVNGTITAAYTLGSNGLITFTVAPPNTHPVTATFTYYWRCRFVKDDLSTREFVRNFFDTQGLELKYVPQ